MTESKSAEIGIGGLAVLCMIAWGAYAWLQPVERVYTTLSTEHAAAIPLVQQLVGPVPGQFRDTAVDDPRQGKQFAQLASLSAGTHAHMTVLATLVEVRALIYASVFLAGVPLLVAAWQLGKAHRRARMRRGIAPDPFWQKVGWWLASAGVLLVPVIPGPFAAAAAIVPFGWLGVGGATLSAAGTCLIGRHSRSG